MPAAAGVGRADASCRGETPWQEDNKKEHRERNGWMAVRPVPSSRLGQLPEKSGCAIESQAKSRDYMPRGWKLTVARQAPSMTMGVETAVPSRAMVVSQLNLSGKPAGSV